MAITELERALAREDAQSLISHVDARSEYFSAGAGEWPKESAVHFGQDLCFFYGDDEKVLAFVVIAAARSNNVDFLQFVGAGLLEAVLCDPSPTLLNRIVVEARRSARFRWLLSIPFKVAVSPPAWKSIEEVRITGPHQEPAADTLPPRD